MGTIVFIAIVIGIIWLMINNSNAKAAEKKRLYDNYQEALASGNKAAALDHGRAYYSYLRKGTLTMYDEQALTNDLSTMK